jgi:hypothetical protein
MFARLENGGGLGRGSAPAGPNQQAGGVDDGVQDGAWNGVREQRKVEKVGQETKRTGAGKSY